MMVLYFTSLINVAIVQLWGSFPSLKELYHSFSLLLSFCDFSASALSNLSPSDAFWQLVIFAALCSFETMIYLFLFESNLALAATTFEKSAQFPLVLFYKKLTPATVAASSQRQ